MWLNYFPDDSNLSLQWTLFGSITGGIIVLFILRTFWHKICSKRQQNRPQNGNNGSYQVPVIPHQAQQIDAREGLLNGNVAYEA